MKKYLFEAMHSSYGHWYGARSFIGVTREFKRYDELRGRKFRVGGCRA